MVALSQLLTEFEGLLEVGTPFVGLDIDQFAELTLVALDGFANETRSAGEADEVDLVVEEITNQ